MFVEGLYLFLQVKRPSMSVLPPLVIKCFSTTITISPSSPYLHHHHQPHHHHDHPYQQVQASFSFGNLKLRHCVTIGWGGCLWQLIFWLMKMGFKNVICLPCQSFVVVMMMRTIMMIMMIILNMNIAGSPLLLALLWTLLVYCQSASNRRDKVRLPAGSSYQRTS